MIDTHDGLKTTPLFELHQRLGAKLVPFAGYAMPVQYPTGVMAEHLHTRDKAGLFDVSHMGQAQLSATGDTPVAQALESVVPADIQSLQPGRQRYTQFLNQDGGILDDLMVTAPAPNCGLEGLLLVVNAACKDADFAHLTTALGGTCALTVFEERALLALQGPAAAGVAEAVLGPEASALAFMAQTAISWNGATLWISRSGYSGEDGFEISVPNEAATALAEALLAHPDVAPIGLGARDSLRLEAGLCLYGQDIDTDTSPVEAGLTWSIGKTRRTTGGFPGAERVLRELTQGASKRRVGIQPEGRAPARAGTQVLDTNGIPVGTITSGGYGPSVGGPVAMGYVPAALAKPGTPVLLDIRGKHLPAQTVTLPFVPPRYHRGGA